MLTTLSVMCKHIFTKQVKWWVSPKRVCTVHLCSCRTILNRFWISCQSSESLVSGNVADIICRDPDDKQTDSGRQVRALWFDILADGYHSSAHIRNRAANDMMHSDQTPTRANQWDRCCFVSLPAWLCLVRTCDHGMRLLILNHHRLGTEVDPSPPYR